MTGQLLRSCHALWRPCSSCARHYSPTLFFVAFTKEMRLGSSSRLAANSPPTNVDTSRSPLPTKQRADTTAVESKKEEKERRPAFRRPRLGGGGGKAGSPPRDRAEEAPVNVVAPETTVWSTVVNRKERRATNKKTEADQQHQLQ